MSDTFFDHQMKIATELIRSGAGPEYIRSLFKMYDRDVVLRALRDVIAEKGLDLKEIAKE